MEGATRNVTFKLKQGDDLRRWTCCRDSLSFQQVLEHACQLFSSVVKHDTAVLRYQDDEGDWVTLACDEDMAEAISIADAMSDGKKPVVRIDVTSSQPTARTAISSSQSAEAASRVAELEATVMHLELETKRAAETAAKMSAHIHEEGKKAAQKAVTAAKQEAEKAAGVMKELSVALQQEALPKLAEGIKEVVASMTPRGEPPHSALQAVQELVRHAMPAKELATHPGVECDVCSMNPIVGARYKKKGANYDLCAAHYDQLAAEQQADFIRIENPQQPWRAHRCRRGSKPVQKPPKPQARFVGDVNIPDNTEILPGTQFTKIWTLRNTGTTAWPADTKLLQVGGDKFGGDTVADVAPAPAGEEVEVAVSLIAPCAPGRYVSYWRLAEPPSMRKFGQRIWVQVVVVREDGSVEFDATEDDEGLAVHPCVECDGSGMSPIVGARFNLKGEDYDLCQAEWEKLVPDQQVLYQRIDYPGAEPVDLGVGAVEGPDAAPVKEELEARHGWSAASINIVQHSALARTVESLRGSVGDEVLQAAMHEVEPVFAVPEPCLARCLDLLVPLVVALREDPALVQTALPEMVASLVADPEGFVLAADAEPTQGAVEEAFEEAAVIQTDPDAENEQENVHAGIWCDCCKANPLRGDRYFKQLPNDTYDLCGACFSQLDDAEKAELQLFGAQPAEETPDATRATAALAEMGIEMADLSASMMAEVEHAVCASPEEHAAEAEQARLVAHAEAAQLAADAELAATTGSEPTSPAASLQDALEQMGMGENELSASMAAEIQQMVKENAEQAQAAAEEAPAQPEQTEPQGFLQNITHALYWGPRADAQRKEQDATAEEETDAAHVQEEAAVHEEEAAEAVEAEAEAVVVSAEEEQAALEAAEKELAMMSEEERQRCIDEPLVSQLVAMGFGLEAAQATIAATGGNMDEAINVLISQPAGNDGAVESPADEGAAWNSAWDEQLSELAEMGFEEDAANRDALHKAAGDVKEAVKLLVEQERLVRQ